MRRKSRKKTAANEKIKPKMLETENVANKTVAVECGNLNAETSVSEWEYENAESAAVECEYKCESPSKTAEIAETIDDEQEEEIIADKSPELSARKNRGRFRSLDFGKCVFAYVLGGVVGTLWETVLNYCKGNGFVYCNGSIFTPINFVYGFGALVIWIFLANSNRKPYMTYIYGAIGGGIVEYLLNFLEEKILGARSWDYSNEFLNINGRTTIPFMLFWGLLCLAVVYGVYNPLAKIYDKCPKKVMTTIAIVLLAIVVTDLTITVTALARYSARQQGVISKTELGLFLDRVFNDDYMKLHFP
ncbi:MAG: putative ABC transporter permease, partial [Clostridia bacterium]|nr:putative ABC transporter permease [Clostridia bacterium]